MTQARNSFAGWHVAQLNVGRLVAPLDSPELADFVANLDPVNGLADASPGFVWRLQDDSGSATSIDTFDDPTVIVNLSMWQSIDALKAFVYQGIHRDVLRRRGEWFQAEPITNVVAWWVPAGHIPTPEEARQRLDFRRAYGPTSHGFDLANPLPPLWFERTSLDDPAAQELIGELNAELASAYPAPGANHFGLTDAELAPGVGTFLVGRLDGVPVACGAMRSIAPGFGELKRMYTRPIGRGKRIAASLVAQLEAEAVALGLSELCLETGPTSHGAIRLYERARFTYCAPWGEYVLTPQSSYCMHKTLRVPHALD